MKTPLVSIVIPVYNRTEELKRSIKSCLLQTYENWELWVIDDNSTTNIQAITSKFNDKRINYSKLPIRSNANVARNKGIQLSKGKWIFLLDSDDEYMPNHIERYLYFIKSNDVDGIFSGIHIKTPISVRNIETKIDSNSLSLIDNILTGYIASTPTFCIKKECFEQIKFDPQFERHQDWDFAQRFSEIFTFVALEGISVIVNWPQKNIRIINLNASKLFLEKYQFKISNKNYIKYNTNMYLASISLCSSSEIKNYYLNNLLKRNDLTKNDFYTIYEAKQTLFSKLIITIKYYIYKLTL